MAYRYNEREMIKSNSDYELYETTVTGIEFYINYNNLTAYCFKGNRTKASWKYRFKDAQKIIKYIDDEIKRHLENQDYKVQAKKQKKEKTDSFRDSVKVGDIFTTSWGYEQTNRDFFQVIAKPSKARVIVKEISSKVVKETSWCSHNVTPVKDSFIGDEKTCSINAYGISNADRYGNTAYPASTEESYHVSWGY